jgi:hypothetical protein
LGENLSNLVTLIAGQLFFEQKLAFVQSNVEGNLPD